MTCIAGLVDHHGAVWIGGDSAGTDNFGLQTIHEDKKVFLLNPPDQPDYRKESPTLLVGGTGSFRFRDLLQYTLEVPPYDPAMSMRKYLVTAFVDAVRTCLKSAGYDKKQEGEEQGGEVLIGWHGRLFHMQEDYQISEASIRYDATGAGTGIALGTLFATQHLGLSPEERVKLALEAAAYHCDSVRPPFLIMRLERGNEPLSTTVLARV